MSSHWRCKILDQELGPLAYDELVELVRSGKLSEDDLVQREPRAPWQPAGSVVGLLRAARRIAEPAADAPAAESPPATAAEAADRILKNADADELPVNELTDNRNGWQMSAWWGVAVLVTVIGIGSGVWSSMRENERFPRPAAARQQSAETYHFLGYGPLSFVEFGLLWIDLAAVVAIAGACCERLVRRRQNE